MDNIHIYLYIYLEKRRESSETIAFARNSNPRIRISQANCFVPEAAF